MREEEFWASGCGRDKDVNQFWKLHPRPRNLAVGDKIYWAERGLITSWSPILWLGEKSFTCQVSGKEWSGYHALLGRTRVLEGLQIRCSAGLQTWQYAAPAVQKRLDYLKSALLTREMWWKIYLPDLSADEIIYFTLCGEGNGVLEKWDSHYANFQSLELDQYQWMRSIGERIRERLGQAVRIGRNVRRGRIIFKALTLLNQSIEAIDTALAAKIVHK